MVGGIVGDVADNMADKVRSSEENRPDSRFITNKLKAIRELPMRAAALLKWLSTADPGTAADALHQIVVGFRSQPSQCALVFHALATLLTQNQAPYPLLESLYSTCHEKDYQLLTELLLTGKAEEIQVPETRDRKAVEKSELTLGEKRTLARGSRAQFLPLLSDPHPMVVEHILQNPKLVEADVIRMAAMARQSGRSLALMACSARFGPRQNIRCAIAQNPDAPTTLALRLLPTLSYKDSIELSQNPKLAPRVRLLARRLSKLT